MVKAGQQVLRCAYPGCEHEPRPGEAGAEPGYCGLPDPVTGDPHTALTAFRRRQMLARQGGGVAGPQNPGRPGFGFWRRRQRAEADAREAHLAALEADAQLAEALAAKAGAEQEAEAARARAAQAERAAEEQVAAARQERDDAVSGAESRVAEASPGRPRQSPGRPRQSPGWPMRSPGRPRRGRSGTNAASGAESRATEAESRATEAGQNAARAREAAESAREEDAEAEVQPARADRDQAAGQAAPGQPKGPTRRRRRSGGS